MRDQQIGREAVLNQLERMLSSPLFRHSKRYPAFLRFVVEHSLNEEGEPLKERTLGVQVFGRIPDYDTNEDPIVRVTAGEVRKRIAQYYHEPEQHGELRIDLPPGSYLAEFHFRSAEPDPAQTKPFPILASEPGLPESSPVFVTGEDAGRDTGTSSGRWRLWALTCGGVAVGLACAAWLWPPESNVVDRFWAPVIARDSGVIVCIGQRSFIAPMDQVTTAFARNALPPGDSKPRAGTDMPLAQLYYLGSQNVALVDSVALTHIVSLLEYKKKKVRIRGERAISLDDLRSEPAVLIGGFSNDWTLLLTGPLRFRFQRDGGVVELRDTQKPDDHNLSVDLNRPFAQATQDYALVTRERDGNTDRFILVFGGLMGFGTRAASEFLTNPAYMASFLAKAPPDWERKNLQIVRGLRLSGVRRDRLT